MERLADVCKGNSRFCDPLSIFFFWFSRAFKAILSSFQIEKLRWYPDDRNSRTWPDHHNPSPIAGESGHRGFNQEPKKAQQMKDTTGSGTFYDGATTLITLWTQMPRRNPWLESLLQIWKTNGKIRWYIKIRQLIRIGSLENTKVNHIKRSSIIDHSIYFSFSDHRAL